MSSLSIQINESMGTCASPKLCKREESGSMNESGILINHEDSISIELQGKKASFFGLKVANQGCATLLYLLVLFCVKSFFAGIVVATETGAEMQINEEYFALMNKIKANLSSEAYDELVNFIGVDPSIGSNNFVSKGAVEGVWVENTWEGFVSAFYFVFIVSTTIGYGDIVPVTTGGKVATVFAMLITIPIAVITYLRVADFILVTVMKIFLKRSTEFKTVLRRFDADNSGTLDKEELQGAFAALGVNMTMSEIELIIVKYDTDGNHVLDISEFVDAANSLGVEFGSIARDTLRIYFSVGCFVIYAILFCIFTGLGLDLTAIDAVYFTSATMTTVGLGDYSLDTNTQRLALIIPIFLGLGMLALVISSMTTAGSVSEKDKHTLVAKHSSRKMCETPSASPTNQSQTAETMSTRDFEISSSSGFPVTSV